MHMTFSMKFIFNTAVVVTTLCFGCFFSSSARVVTVGIANGNALSFFPAVTNISTGDQVIWVWNNTSNTHSTTQTNSTTHTSLWDSELQTAPFSFTNTFNSAGTFLYECTKHVTMGMTGAVIVAVANLPPTVSITNPVSGTIFTAPANITIQASASDSDGTVTNVQFLIGSTVLTNQAVAPFSAVTNNLAAGNYTLSAIASDNNGATATNSVNIVVDAPPIVTITNPVSGTVFAAPANVTIRASASDSDGTVTNVQFLIGSTVLTNEAAAPFSAVTNNLASGSYTLSAVASDNNGIKATNTATISVVTPVPVSISSPLRPSPTNFQFSYAANAGLRYVVQRSTNLLSTNWFTLATNTAAGNPVNFADTNATANPGFYRVGRLLNP
jgi:plastocyanin